MALIIQISGAVLGTSWPSDILHGVLMRCLMLRMVLGTFVEVILIAKCHVNTGQLRASVSKYCLKIMTGKGVSFSYSGSLSNSVSSTQVGMILEKTELQAETIFGKLGGLKIPC